MPPSSRSRGSPTTPSVGLQEGRLGRRNEIAEQWNARFEELLNYRSEHGHCDVPNRGGKLGKWVGRQRTAYKNESLGQDRIDRLSSIGFKWSLKGLQMPPSSRSRGSPTTTSVGLQEGRLGRRNEIAEQWNARFEELLKYKSEHGDCNVPGKQGKLGRWVGTQCAAYRAASLEQDRIARLDIIGFK